MDCRCTVDSRRGARVRRRLAHDRRALCRLHCNPLPVRLDLNLPEGLEPFMSASSVAFSPSGSLVALVGIVEGNRRRTCSPRPGRLRSDQGHIWRVLAVLFAGRPIALVYCRASFPACHSTMGSSQLGAGCGSLFRSRLGPGQQITFLRQGALWQVPASGGTSKQLTTLDAAKHEVSHSFPAVAADGRVVFMAVDSGGTRSATHIEAVSADSGERHTVVESGTTPLYTPSGHLAFFRDAALLAMPFDLDRREPTGPAVRVVNSVYATTFGAAMFGVSTAGSLIYMGRSASTQLVWVSRRTARSDACRTKTDRNVSGVVAKGLAQGALCQRWRRVDDGQRPIRRHPSDEGRHQRQLVSRVDTGRNACRL